MGRCGANLLLLCAASNWNGSNRLAYDYASKIYTRDIFDSIRLNQLSPSNFPLWKIKKRVGSMRNKKSYPRSKGGEGSREKEGERERKGREASPHPRDVWWVPTVTAPHVRSKSGQTGLTTVLPVNGRRPGIANEFVCDRMVMLLRAVLMTMTRWGERARGLRCRVYTHYIYICARTVYTATMLRAHCCNERYKANGEKDLRARVYAHMWPFAIYCLATNLPSEWPWALPPLPTDIRRRKLPIVSMERDSYCAPT